MLLRILILLGLFFGFGGAFSSRAADLRGRALVVGVEDYDDPQISDLRYSVDDAKLLADLLGDPARGIFGAQNVRLLTSDQTDAARKPTRLAILENIEWLADAEPDETILLYFSGHGLLDPDGKQFLAPCDVKASAPSYTGVPIEVINAILDNPGRTKARQIVVIFDSCHSGVRRGAKGGTSESGQVIQSLLSTAEGRVTLASCNADEQSFEDETLGHGIFTQSLAEALKGAADANSDGLIGAGEIHVFVREKVTSWARGRGLRQTPRVQSNVSGEIFLARDPAKFAAFNAARALEQTRLAQTREKLTAKIGGEGVSVEEGARLLRALDAQIAGNASEDDQKLATLAEKFGRGELAAPALRAEMVALAPRAAPITAPASADSPLKLQLFQPGWQPGQTPDSLEIACAPGEAVKVVGLASSPGGITRVLLDGKPLGAGSLGARDLVLVRKTTPQTELRFEGTLQAGQTPQTATLLAVDASGARQTLQLTLVPNAAQTVGWTPIQTATGTALQRPPTVAVIGLSKRRTDEYEELRAVRVGQGLQQILTRATRTAGRFTLVEEKSEVLRGLAEMQWTSRSAAFDPATAVQTGKLLGARYVLYGDVYDFATPRENKGKLFVAVEVRLVDVETARYVAGYGEASLPLPRAEKADAEFDRSTLAQVSGEAIRLALADLLQSGGAR